MARISSAYLVVYLGDEEELVFFLKVLLQLIDSWS